MPTERELAAKFTTLIAHGQYAGGRYMYTGRLTATGVTLDGAAINKVWVRAEEDSREETQVWGSAQRINLRVWVQPNAAGELMITEPDYSASAYSGQEGVAGSLMPAITPENNPNLLIGGRQFKPGRMRVSTLGGLYVYVEPFHYDGGYWPGGDFLMTVPGTALMQAWCGVAMNPADDTLYQFTGTEYALPYLMTEVELGDLTVTPGYIPVGAVVLQNGQTTITGAEMWADFHYHFSAVEGRATVQTTDATVTTIASVSVAEDEVVTVTATVSGAIADYSAAIGGTLMIVARRAAGGNVTLVGSVTTDVEEDSGSSPTFTADVDTGTQTVRVRVTGVAAETWNWRCTFDVLRENT